MTWSVCDGSYIDESVAAVYDHVAEQYRTFPHHCRHTAEARQHDHRAERPVRRFEMSESETETRVVAALVTLAGRAGTVETAAARGYAQRDAEGDGDLAEAVRIARQQGWDDGRLIAMKGLAASRGVSLEIVLRAALRGELREVVKLPPVAPAP